jgi:hypothetical protein
MAKKVDPKVLSNVLDCVDGTWSVIVDDLLLCYGMVGGTKSKLSIALFDKIARSIKLRAPSDESQAKVKKGSIWSSPMKIEDIVSTCTSTSAITNNIQNYRRYLNELVDGNVFYRFGRSGHYAYTYERNVCSWSCFSSGESYVYPTLIKKILSSESDLWLLFWNHSKSVGDASVMTMDGFVIEFAKFVDGLLDKLPPVAKALCRKFDERESPRLYLSEIDGVISKMDDFKGFYENSSFDINKLPASVTSRYYQMCGGDAKKESAFLDIIPEEDGGRAPKRKAPNRINQRALFGIERHVVEKSIEANLTTDSSLNPMSNSRHLLSLLERRIKKIKGLPEDPHFVISKNLSSENREWQKLVDQLTIFGVISNSFIREWVDWFSVSVMPNKDIDSKTVLVAELYKTLSKFMAIRKKDHPDSDHSTIYEDMRKRYDGVEPVETLCMKYGLFLPYSFLHVKFGEKEACLVYEDMFHRLNEKPLPVRRNILAEIVRITYSRSQRTGMLKLDSPMMKRLDDFLTENACQSSDLGLSFSSDSDVAERAFWRKIANDNR